MDKVGSGTLEVDGEKIDYTYRRSYQLPNSNQWNVSVEANYKGDPILIEDHRYGLDYALILLQNEVKVKKEAKKLKISNRLSRYSHKINGLNGTCTQSVNVKQTARNAYHANLCYNKNFLFFMLILCMLRDRVLSRKAELDRIQKEPYVERDIQPVALEHNLIKVIMFSRRAAKSFFCGTYIWRKRDFWGYVNFDTKRCQSGARFTSSKAVLVMLLRGALLLRLI